MPAAAQKPATPAVGLMEFVQINVTRDRVAFVTPQLTSRDGNQAESTMIEVIDPPAAKGAVTAASTQTFDCKTGSFRTRLMILRGGKGEELQRQAPAGKMQKPNTGSADAANLLWACERKLADPQAPRYADLQAAIAGARTALRRGPTQAGRR